MTDFCLSPLRGALHRSTALASPAPLAVAAPMAPLAVLLLLQIASSPAHAQTAGMSAPQPELPTIMVTTTSIGGSGGRGAGLAPFTPIDTSTLSADEAARATLFTSDSGSLVSRLPGGAAWGAGGVSSLPMVNGMGADRVQVAINSMIFSPACPNEMNPPLSYVNPAQISKVKVYTATAPVSAGGDYTGARVDVSLAPPAFTPGQAVKVTGSVSGFYRGNGNGYGVDVNATASNEDTSVTYTGGWVRASDYTSGNGTVIKSTMYETQNHALSISKKLANDGLLTVQVGGQFIPYQGYVNQYMDMVDNKSVFVNGAYEGYFDWGKLEATAFANNVRHTMGFIQPDKTGDMPMDTRSTDMGYTVKGTIAASAIDVVRVGNDLFYNNLDDWWPPVDGSMMMGPNTFININNGQRLRFGYYAEWQRQVNAQWSTIIGLRNDIVWMNTGDVQGYNEMMYGANAAAFNALSHQRTDFNIDGSAIVRYEANAFSLYEFGLARKTRSPNLYERYAWSTNAMAMDMIGWFGDGNGYVGNIDLVPEKAHTVSFTADWHDPANKVWQLRVSPYYSYVQDYIDVQRCALPGCLSSLPNNLTAQNTFVFLQFANFDAWLYGVNIDGKLALWDDRTYGQGTFRGALNFVRGQRTDGINLYHMMPVNATLALDHTLGNWSSSFEVQLVGAKTLVNEVRNEVETSAYALLNFRTSYQWNQVNIAFGIDNILDTEYDLPLGGANLVNYQVSSMMGTSPAWGYPVAGPGRSINTRVTVSF
ncbi:TonB-dependent receptor [Aquabacter sp. P-9]|uniref:TonB-dependent receptor n=1 Tax=Aquabacter sediminis TaxID=3029197 RepID=UPI00237D6999|nr:TonB-dependent receptor plug domain-containing protein [Aquabacter sp. P-9]MDE1566594.1 TonB-dependent receptor plug domain-containing protein [Aquabacter sp. P-9]